jgi:hypothetical protein
VAAQTPEPSVFDLSHIECILGQPTFLVANVESKIHAPTRPTLSIDLTAPHFFL